MCDFSSVKVAVRIRPLNDEEVESKEVICVKTSGENQIVVGKDLNFTFDHLFKSNSLQSDIFDLCVADLISSAFQGYNATVLAYGQTGSGKTYTMGMSTERAPSISKSFDDQGIVPRSIQAIFDAITAHCQEDSRHKFTVHVQFIEIYGDDIRDLNDASSSGFRASKNASATKDRDAKPTLRETANGDVFVTGVREETVTSVAHAIEILQSGGKQRATAATGMNSESSRSHAIFTIVLEKTFTVLNDNTVSISGSLNSAVDTSSMTVRRSSIHFVDLAGSERVKRTHANGLHLREGIDINRGLLALGNVISALGDSQRRGKVHVPYRDSKLTRLLQNSLGGNSRTLFMCCVSPASKDFVESVNALKYANRARNIRNKPIVNSDPTIQAADALQLLVQKLASQLLATMKPHSEYVDSLPLTSQVLFTPPLLEALLSQEFLTEPTREQPFNNVNKNRLSPSRTFSSQKGLEHQQNIFSPLLTDPTQPLQSTPVREKRRSSIGTAPSRELTFSREDLLQAREEAESYRAQLAEAKGVVMQLKEQLGAAQRIAQELDSRSLHLESERDGCKYKLDTIRASVNANTAIANLFECQSDDEESDSGSATDDSVIDNIYNYKSNRTVAEHTPYESYLIAKLSRKDSKIKNLKRQKYDLLSNYRAQSRRLQQLKLQVKLPPQLEPDDNIDSPVNPVPPASHQRVRPSPSSARAKLTHSPRITPRASNSRQFTTPIQHFDDFDTDQSCYSGHTPAACTLSPIQEATDSRDENLSPNVHTPRVNDTASLNPRKRDHLRQSLASDSQVGLCNVSTVNIVSHSVEPSFESNIGNNMDRTSGHDNVNERSAFYTSPSRAGSMVSQITCDSHTDSNVNAGPSFQKLQFGEIGTIAGGTPVLSRQDDDRQCSNDINANTSLPILVSNQNPSRLTLMYGQVQNIRNVSDEEKERLCQHISTLKAEWRSLQLSTLEELNELRTRLTESQAQAEAYSAEKDRLTTAIEAIMRRESSCDSVDALRVQCEDLQEQLAATKEGMILVIDSLQQQVCQLKEENKALSQTQESTSVFANSNKIHENNSAQLHLRAQIADLLGQLECQQSVHIEKVTTLKQQINNMEKRMSDDQEELVNILLEKNSLCDKVNELSTTITALQQQHQQIDSSVDRSKIEPKHGEDSQEIFRVCSQLVEVNQSLESVKHQLNDERAVVTQSCDDHCSRNLWQSDEIDRMHEIIARLTSQLEASSQSSQLDKQLMRERIMKLSGQMAELRETSVSEKDELLRQLADAKAAQDISVGFRDDVARLNHHISELTHDLETMREDRDLVIEELQKVERQLAESQEAHEIERLLLTDRLAEMDRSRSFWGGEDFVNSFVQDYEEDRDASPQRLARSLGVEIHQNHRLSVSPSVINLPEQKRFQECCARIVELETEVCNLKSKCEDDIGDYVDKLSSVSEECHSIRQQKELLEQKVASLECELALVRTTANTSMIEDDMLRRESDVIPQPSLQVKLLSTQLKDCRVEIDRLKQELAASTQLSTSRDTQNSDRDIIKQLNEEIDHIQTYVIAERDRLAVRVKVLTQELDSERNVRSNLEAKLEALAPKVTTLERREAELASELQRTVRVKEQSVQQLEELNQKLSAVIESSVEEKSVLAQRIAELDAQLHSNDRRGECNTSNEPASPRGRRDTKLWFAPYDDKRENEFLRRHRDIAELWARQFHAMLEYCRHHGTCNVPRDYVHGDLALGKWLRTQKTLGTSSGRPRLLPERLTLMQKLVDSGLMSWDVDT